MPNDQEAIGCGIVVAAVMFFLGCTAGVGFTNNAWMKDALQRNVAEYNSKTGEFQWKYPIEKGEPNDKVSTKD